MNNKKCSLIAAYSLDGKLIKTYQSARQASLKMHVFNRTIDKATREHSIIHNKQWRRVDKNNIPDKMEPFVKEKTYRSIRPICEIDENNKVIKAYPSIRNASILNNIDPHSIRDNLNNKTNKAGGKKYRYLTLEEIDIYGFKEGSDIVTNKTPVIQLSLDEECIKSYKSISEALKAINKEGRYKELKDALSGKYSTAFGFIWKYKDSRKNVNQKKKVYIYKIDPVTKKIIEKFKSTKEASMSTGISISSINNAIRKRQKTAGGYKWIRK